MSKYFKVFLCVYVVYAILLSTAFNISIDGIESNKVSWFIFVLILLSLLIAPWVSYRSSLQNSLTAQKVALIHVMKPILLFGIMPAILILAFFFVEAGELSLDFFSFFVLFLFIPALGGYLIVLGIFFALANKFGSSKSS
jgi:hypothetical protein